MKQISFWAGILLLLQSCTGKITRPAAADIAGTWKSKDGATVSINANGTLTATAMPTVLFYYLNKQFPGQLFDGHGRWKLVDGQSHWELDIVLDETSLKENRVGMHLLINGSGALEKKAPWKSLFLWKDEEGGERYEFIRQ